MLLVNYWCIFKLFFPLSFSFFLFFVFLIRKHGNSSSLLKRHWIGFMQIDVSPLQKPPVCCSQTLWLSILCQCRGSELFQLLIFMSVVNDLNYRLISLPKINICNGNCNQMWYETWVILYFMVSWMKPALTCAGSNLIISIVV